MTQTADQEREWWETAGPENIWGLGTWEEGIAGCVEQIESILAGLSHGACVLDLGCGPGRLLVPLARAHPQCTFTGLDIRFYDHAHINERNIGWMVGDGRRIGYADEMLDAIYSVALFQHLPHEATRGYLAESARTLKPGGQVRFQHVLGSEDSFLAHQVLSATHLTQWCDDAVLEIVATDEGVLHFQWVWVTARKP